MYRTNATPEDEAAMADIAQYGFFRSLVMWIALVLMTIAIGVNGATLYESWTKAEMARIAASPGAQAIAKANADRAMFEHIAQTPNGGCIPLPK